MTDEWNIVQDRNNPAEWRVENCNADKDGACSVTIFSGYHAKDRAHAYHASLNTGA